MYILAGKFSKKKLKAPKTDETRPTTAKLRESLFNILQGELEGAHFLDLFAGSGAVGLEALSRGAKKVTFVENNPPAIRALQDNIRELCVKGETVVFSYDVFMALPRLLKLRETFDVIFADAPYHQKEVSKALIEWVSDHSILKPLGRLFIEDSNSEAPGAKNLTLINSRRSGKGYLHQFQAS